MAVQWSLVLFTLFVGLGCWCFVCTAIATCNGKSRAALFPSSIVTLVALGVGGIASVTHLSHPTRLIEALNVPTSSIFMEAAGTFLLAFLVIAYIVLLKRGSAEAALKTVAVLGAVIAVVLSFIVGNSYVIPAREAWDTVALPLAYLGTAMICGSSVFALITSYTKGKNETLFSLVTAGAGIVALLCVVLYGAASGAWTGQSMLVFWGLVVIVGTVVPAVCAFMARSQPHLATPLLAAAFVCAMIGAIAFRVLMWQMGNATIDFFEML